MTLQYFFYLDINIPGRKVFYAYYYRLSVPHAVRAHDAAIIAAYCYDAVTVLSRCRNTFTPSDGSRIRKSTINFPRFNAAYADRFDPHIIQANNPIAR
jgi:hypothetical protein